MDLGLSFAIYDLRIRVQISGFQGLGFRV